MKKLVKVAAVIILCTATAWSSPNLTEWRGAAGRWSDVSHWSNGMPNNFKDVQIGGGSQVTIAGEVVGAASLRVGVNKGDYSKVNMLSGSLLVRQDSLIVGEHTGGVAEFDLLGGRVDSAMDIFVGGATGGAGRMNHSILTVEGGALVGLSLIVGEGLGSESTFNVVGSKINSIEMLNGVQCLAKADPEAGPGRATFRFNLDKGGVAPISIWSQWRGLQIDQDSKSECRLEVGIIASPPPGNITLIKSHALNRGHFANLPEGAEVGASYHGRTFKWKITYCGGASSHDVVLQSIEPRQYRTLRPSDPHLQRFIRPRWWGKPLYPLSMAKSRRAFPGAEGYGAHSAGGRGGETVTVSNLSDSGPGSLRNALQSKFPRHIVFKIGGVITLKTDLIINSPYVTIDGSTAPAPGITVTGHGIVVNTNDVILRYLRIRIRNDRKGLDDGRIIYAAGEGQDGLSFEDGASNDIADHLSISWATNKLITTTKRSDRITIQWCILSESLNIDGHGYAAIVGGNRVTWHHNLFVHNFSRNPRFQGIVDADFRNNVIYDWGEKAGYGEFDRLNYVGNYLKGGSSTIQRPRLYLEGTEIVQPRSLYIAGNVLEDDADASAENWKGSAFYYKRKTLDSFRPFPAPFVSTETATQAYREVLMRSGATKPIRDCVDRLAVDDIQNGRGSVIADLTPLTINAMRSDFVSTDCNSAR